MAQVQFRKGDIVTIEAKVDAVWAADTHNESDRVYLSFNYANFTANFGQVSLARKHLAVGEFVSLGGGGSVFEVACVHGEHAWVVNSLGEPDTFLLKALTLADKPLWAHERDGTEPPAPIVDERLAADVDGVAERLEAAE